MQKTSIILAAVAMFGLAGCLESDLERGVVGAGVGVVGAQALGTDPTATALAGASAALFCDDAGICRPSR